MEEPTQVTITDIYATADQLIARLSHHLGGVDEIEYWEDPDHYDLKRTHENGEEEKFELTDEDISYDSTIPGVVFQLETQNANGDTLYLTYMNPDGQAEPYRTGYEDEPGELEWIDEKLTTIDDVVHDIQTRLTPLEDAAQHLTEEIPGFDTSIENIERKVTNIDAFMQNIVTEIGKLQTAITNLEAKLTPIENIEGKLTPIEDINVKVTKLAQSAQIVEAGFPLYDSYVRGQFKTIIDAVAVKPNTPLDQIEAQLLGEQKYVQDLTESPDKQWKLDLVARQFNFWKGIVPFVKKAQQTGPSKSLELLQTDVDENLSDSYGKEKLISLLTSPELKRDALKRINKALALVNT